MTREETGPFTDPDVRLMLRVRKGDEAAFEELVHRHQRNVLNLVYRYLGDASAAEDAAQDVFVKVHRARHKYEPAAKFSTWLYRVTVNHCLNVLRARKSRPIVAEPVEDLLEHPSAEDPDARLDQQELQGAVKAALASLPPQQRIAVLLARFEELSYNEIAETMDLSLEAVKSLLFRAKENLQRLLGRYAGE
ncbi:MAG: RNA polymerase sigma factor [Planctomycetota bacterium]|jgi:RNA polymerase sigma-70 factor (ECF subfamily)